MRKTNQSLLQHIDNRFRTTACVPTKLVQQNLQLYRALKYENRCGKIDDEEFAKASLRLIQKIRLDAQATNFIAQYMNELNKI